MSLIREEPATDRGCRWRSRGRDTALGIQLTWPTWNDLASNVAGSAAWAALAAAAAGIVLMARRYNRRRAAGKLWATFLTDTVIVLGVQKRQWTWKVEPSGMVGAGDIRGLAFVSRRLEKIGADRFSVKLGEDLSLDDWQSNLILLGGADCNPAVEQMLPRLTSILALKNDSKDLDLRDTRRSSGILPVTWMDDTTKTTFVDYGLIVFGKNPADRRRSVLILAGGTGFGTQAAAWRCASTDYLRERIPRSGRGFVETFVIDVIDHWPGVPREVLINESSA